MTSFENKVAFITGGASGIGFAIATLLSEKGATVVIADRNEELGPKAAKALNGKGHFVYMDQSLAQTVEQAVTFTCNTLKRLDLAVNCAGVQGPLGPISACEIDEIDQTIKINLLGAAYCLKYLTKSMRECGNGGSVVNIASICGVRPTPFFSVFSASKAGLLSLTEACARECGPDGIRINAISPGYIETPLLNKAIDRDWAAGNTPTRKMGEPRDIAEAALFLLSDSAKQITGVNLRVDGGLVAGHHIPPPGYVESEANLKPLPV